jgi:uncharacterized protein (DUF2225 family)
LEENPMKISYYLKNSITCPVCGTEFYKEEMLSGRGRLIAKDTTDELRRIYEPGRKAGEIYPLIYPITVCPQCLYAAYVEDFQLIDKKDLDIALSQKGKRSQDIALLFPDLDYRRMRNLYTGTASYLLAVGCYSFHSKERAPTFKKGLSSLRAAWLFEDLHRKYQDQNYDKIKLMMYKKATDYYEKTISIAQTGEERVDAVKNFGPDLDKNFGFQGVLFISTLLLFKYGNHEETDKRIAKLQSAKRIISKIFGSGKSSKSKPSFILELSKDLYEKITSKIAELKGE